MDTCISDKNLPHTSFEATVLNEFFSSLNNCGASYAILRNYLNLPYSVGARDIDIIVEPNDLTSVKKIICSIVTKFSLFIVNYYEDERITQFTLLERVDNHFMNIKIDLFTNSQIYGVELFSASQMLIGIRQHNGIPVVSDKFIMLDKFIYHLIVGKPLSEKYNKTFSDITQRELSEIKDLIQPFLGSRLAINLLSLVATGLASKLPPLSVKIRFLILVRIFFKSNFRAKFSLFSFINYRLLNIFFPKGIFFSLSGPDGCGKTALIDNLFLILKRIYGDNCVNYKHFRPNIFPRIAYLAKATNAIKSVDVDYGNPHRSKPSNIIGSIFRLIYYSFDYIFGYFIVIRPLLSKREIVLFDRYYYDMVCDPARSKISIPFRILRYVSNFLPMPTYSFFIHVDAFEVYRRKQELSLISIKELNKKYIKLVNSEILLEIDNNNSIDKSTINIIDTILMSQNNRAHRLLAKFF